MHHFKKPEYAAYTIRGKLHKLLPRYLQPVPAMKGKSNGPGRPACFLSLSSRHCAAGPLKRVNGWDYFLKHNLRRYAKLKNEPSAGVTSGLSPYLHFGHISSLEVALAVRDYAAEHKLIADEFLEELIVRRELAFNFARVSSNPASFDSLPEWARKTLADHARDKRDHVYTRDDFIGAETHDPLWNATQKEMLRTGKIQGY
jgi:deoxyribodipyrimidine photo-lyase